jgi:hypothetical protein
MWNCKFPHVSTVIWPSPTCDGICDFPLYSWTMTSTRSRREGSANPCRARNPAVTAAMRSRRAPSPSPSPRRPSPSSRPLPVPDADGGTRAPWPSAAASGCRNSSSPTPNRRRTPRWRGGGTVACMACTLLDTWRRMDEPEPWLHAPWSLQLHRTRRDLLPPRRHEKATDRRRMHPAEPRCVRLGLPPHVHHLDDGGPLLWPQCPFSQTMVVVPRRWQRRSQGHGTPGTTCGNHVLGRSCCTARA